jgi:nicotinamidase-related amidase
LVETEPGSGQWRQVETAANWDPSGTAVVICDMWDKHWCRGATARVAEMAPRMNQVIAELRRRGVLIIHCPSETMGFYRTAPGRKLAQSAPKVDLQSVMRQCLARQPQTEPPLPIDHSDGGCDDMPRCQEGKWPPFPWSREIATLRVEDGDAITDSVEAYYLMHQRGITNVMVMGVHENMCVLGRPFSIRQMVKLGQNVLLVRDLTDTMYNSRRRPWVDHFTGTDLVCWHIEKYLCPTITSDQIVGGQPFRFAADTKPPRVFRN